MCTLTLTLRNVLFYRYPYNVLELLGYFNNKNGTGVLRENPCLMYIRGHGKLLRPHKQDTQKQKQRIPKPTPDLFHFECPYLRNTTTSQENPTKNPNFLIIFYENKNKINQIRQF